MKECPQCGNKYTDDTLNFCLADGTSLRNFLAEQKTEELSIPTLSLKEDSPTQPETNRQIVAPTQKVQPEGVSPVWIFATFSLLAIILSAGVLFWLISNDFFSPPKNQKQTVNTSINSNFSNTTPNSNSQKGNLNQAPKPKTYKVVGVKSNDVLNIRPQPGNLKRIVGKIPPNGRGIRIIGGSRRVGKGRWVLISYKGRKGWVNRKFITLEK